MAKNLNSWARSGAKIRIGLLSLFVWLACAGEGAAQATRKILFLAGPRSHGPGEHEYPAEALLLADALNKANVGAWAQVHQGWPSQAQAFAGVSAVYLLCDGEGAHVAKGHFPFLDSLHRAGVGLGFVHYGLVVAKGAEGDFLTSWIGGYYETWWSVNPVWTAPFTAMPAHAAAAGVPPFTIRDEWYFHMRFRAGMQGVTPLLTAVPPKETVMNQPDSPHGSNAAVRQEVNAGTPQHMAWIAENPGRGRGFGFTGSHYLVNFKNADYLRLVLNSLLWTAGGNVPVTGVQAAPPGDKELQAFMAAKVPALVPWSTVSIRTPRAGFAPARAARVNALGRSLPAPEASRKAPRTP